jgi:rRNA-processing protein FCF1
MPISGKSVDDALVSYVKEHGGIVATIDAELKMRIKKNGGSILSISSDRIVLEPSKL